MIAIIGSDQYLFGEKYVALTALGRVGPLATAGSRAEAVRVIREVIYDSDSYVIAQRERVIRRLESVASDWMPCLCCKDGHVVELSYRLYHRQPCKTCGGIGLLPQD